MKPRSVLFDIFGSFVRYRGGGIALSSLVQLLSWFGISDDATRVMLSRMRREEWFIAQRSGRSSYYSLTDKGWRLLDEGLTRIFDRRSEQWDGTWQVIVYSLPENHRGLREKIRKELAWRGFGPLAPSTWIGPHDRAAGLQALLPEDATFHVFSSRTGSTFEDSKIASSCWNLRSLNEDYGSFIDQYAPWTEPKRAEQVTAQEAFVIRTKITHDYRRFPFRDPDLPSRLLPRDWSGHEAHGVFRATLANLESRAWEAFDEVYEQPPSGSYSQSA
jgi:phenylacetic acid degradation operon negative regulatory protein